VELDKINTLDEKIGTELKESAAKMKQMGDDLEMFKDLKTLRETSEQRERDLVEQKKGSEVKAVAMKEKHAAALAKYNELKDQLAKDDTAVGLDELELKMRHHEQTVYVLSEYIDTKGAETMFEPIAEECHTIMAQINAETVRVLAEQPVFMAQAGY